MHVADVVTAPGSGTHLERMPEPAGPVVRATSVLVVPSR